jgi:putative ABC transport system permease protein
VLRFLPTVLAEARDNLRESGGRTLLPMLGIVWGVANVVVFLALAQGVHTGILGALGEFGTDIVVLQPGVTSARFHGQLPGKIISLTAADAEAIRRRSRLTASLSPEASAEVTLQSANRSVLAKVCAVEPEYGNLRSMQLAAGRFLNAEDLREHRQVVVLGQELAGRLLGGKAKVGAEVRIGGVRFTAVGLLKQKTTASRFSGPDNRMAFVPLSTAGKLMDTRRLSSIILQPVSFAVHSEAIREATTILAESKHFSPADEQAIAVWDFQETVRMMRGMILGIQAVNVLVGLLTLLVGGVGVMNVMLVAVKERTSEVGLRKAVGARRSHIAFQFLAEALVITLSAGLLGMILGALICRVVPPVPIVMGQAELQASPGVMAGAFSVLLTVGLLAGTLPAIAASRQSPVEALRYD